MVSWWLQRRADGACVHLGEAGVATVLRAAACRLPATFDCRGLRRDGPCRALRPRSPNGRVGSFAGC